MKSLGIGIITACLLLGALAWPASGAVSILVDEIHGRPLSEDLAEALPACEISVLTAEDFPITTLIDSGIITQDDFELLFNVPEGAEALYLNFSFSYTGLQLPFITLYGPGDHRIGSHCEGAMHVENPDPGQYRLVYSTWISMETAYTIGCGPTLFSTDLLDGYDLICTLWDDTMLMFRGELPPYSPSDEAAYMQYLENGGGFLYIREPLIEMALKPIINIYSIDDVVCDVGLGFPGMLTYSDPPCLTESVPGGSLLRWADLQVSGGQPFQILYEGKLARQTNWLQLIDQGGPLTVSSRTDQPLNELHLFRHEGADAWRLVRLGTLSSGTELAVSAGEVLDGRALKNTIENIIRHGGRQAGLFEAEVEEFLERYHWADRWLNDALADGRWCGFYRIGTAAYDAHIPFQAEQAVQQKARTMWIWATGLGGELSNDEAGGPDWSLVSPGIGATTPIIYHEYGVQYQRGSGGGNSEARDFGFLGWEYYDGAALIDPTDNCGAPECPWFTWTGGHPDAIQLMTGVSVVVGSYPGTLTAPWSEQVLIGDDDALTDDWVFPPGSNPPVAAAKSVGLGRAATIHTLAILNDAQDNRAFLGNVVDWLTEPLSPAHDIPDRTSYITAVSPNPFNPRLTVSFIVPVQQQATITVCDLAGKRVATLSDEVFTAGEHQVVWDGQDDDGRALPSGGYFIHLVSGGASQTRKAMLVR